MQPIAQGCCVRAKQEPAWHHPAMADEDVEIVRRTYEAYSRGDLAAAGSAYSEDTVWDVSRF
jgi:hypothetical protein